MDMLRIAVVDDEALALERMASLINEQVNCELVATFSNPFEALDSIPTLHVDVVFIDVEMPGMSGVQLAEKVKTDDIQIVFVTAHSNYALEAFRVEASDYIMKPITENNLERVISKAVKIKQLLALRDEQQENKQQEAEPIMPSRCEVQCFHAFKVVNKNGEIVSWPTRKTEELFAYFIVHKGAIINKWVIAESLWGDRELRNIVHTVHNTIYRLRVTCKNYSLPFQIDAVNEGYILQNVGEAFVDLYKFWDGERVVQLDREMDKAELALYKGPLFNDKDYAWSIGLREKLEMLTMNNVND